jgi:hypothetical protein
MNSNPMLQLNPTIPVVAPDGIGEAMGWIDYGKEGLTHRHVTLEMDT